MNNEYDFMSGSDHMDFAAILGLNDSLQQVNIVQLTSTSTLVDAHTIAWYYDSVNNKTIVYANSGVTSEPIGATDMEIHLNNVTSLQMNDFILHH